MGAFRCLQKKCLLCDVLRLTEADDQQDLAIHDIVHKQSLGVREILFREGDAASHLYLVTSGYVKLTNVLRDGRVHGLRLGTPWQLVGLEAMDSARHSYSAETLTPVDVCTIRFKDMRHLMAQIPQLALRIVETMNRDLQTSNAMIRNLSVATATERVAALLLSILRIEETPTGEFPLPLSRTDMAEMLGLTLETVSRTLSRLVRDEIIWIQPGGRRLRILDAAQLERLGGSSPAGRAISPAYS